jgi:hypothetical protein
LRNGPPFKDWPLPTGLERIRRKLAGSADSDRQMVAILTTGLSDGLPAVEAGCLEAVREGAHSGNIVLNILARRREPATLIAILAPEARIAACPRRPTTRNPTFGESRCPGIENMAGRYLDPRRFSPAH